MVSPVDIYRDEFTNNAVLTKYLTTISSKNLCVPSATFKQYNFILKQHVLGPEFEIGKARFLFTKTQSLLNFSSCENKFNFFAERANTNLIKKLLLFQNFKIDSDSILKQDIFAKYKF